MPWQSPDGRGLVDRPRLVGRRPGWTGEHLADGRHHSRELPLRAASRRWSVPPTIARSSPASRSRTQDRARDGHEAPAEDARPAAGVPRATRRATAAAFTAPGTLSARRRKAPARLSSKTSISAIASSFRRRSTNRERRMRSARRRGAEQGAPSSARAEVDHVAQGEQGPVVGREVGEGPSRGRGGRCRRRVAASSPRARRRSPPTARADGGRAGGPRWR